MSRRAARLPHVRRLRHERRQALPRADRGGSERQDAGELLRFLQAARRGLYASRYRRDGQGARGAREALRQALTAHAAWRGSAAACSGWRARGASRIRWVPTTMRLTSCCSPSRSRACSTRPAAELARDFLGREPNLDAYRRWMLAEFDAEAKSSSAAR